MDSESESDSHISLLTASDKDGDDDDLDVISVEPTLTNSSMLPICLSYFSWFGSRYGLY